MSERSSEHDNNSRTTPAPSASGPLQGIRVIELAGLGPAPLCGMLLADLGADVIVIDRPSSAGSRSIGNARALNRGKRSIVLDLKSDAGQRTALELIHSADAVIEGFRPGVMERLGLGPDVFKATHPRLVYGRVTGWGQTGPLAQRAGHDINYLALSGALSIASRPGQAPSAPASLLGDMGGGAMLLALGLLSALLEAQRSGRGQVIDAAILEGLGLLGGLVSALRSEGQWSERPADNFFLHSSPFYDCFECADGGHLSLGAIEPQFYTRLLQGLGLHDVDPAQHMNTEHWPALRARVAERIKTRSRAQWEQDLADLDCCVAPVLSLDEAATHAQAQARGNHVRIDGHWQPSPAPRFSRSRLRTPEAGPHVGEHTEEILTELHAARTARET